MSGNIYYKLITPFKSKENNKYNYVYQITEISTGKKYIGSRGSTLEPNKDIKNYKSSSTDKQFKKNQKLNPLNYWYEILSYHETREDATRAESVLHKQFNVSNNTKYFNRSIQLNDTFYISSDISGDLVHINSGTIPVRYANEVNGKKFRVSTSDPRYLSGELVHISTGTVTVKNKLSGITERVSTSDPRYLSGELVQSTSGMVNVFDELGVLHNVSVTDPRYLSGELVHVFVGMITAKDARGNTTKISTSDPKYISGEFVQIRTKMYEICGEIMTINQACTKYKISRSVAHNRICSDRSNWVEWKRLQ